MLASPKRHSFRAPINFSSPLRFYTPLNQTLHLLFLSRSWIVCNYQCSEGKPLCSIAIAISVI